MRQIRALSHPDNPVRHNYSLGEALREAGRLEESIANYRRSVELDPGNDNARRFIAEMEEELAGASRGG